MQIQQERERTRKQGPKRDFPRSICCSTIIMVKSVAPSLLLRSFCQICFVTGHKGDMQSMNTITFVITIPNVIARGGTLGISGWGCAAGSLEPLTFTRASSAEFCYPILE